MAARAKRLCFFGEEYHSISDFCVGSLGAVMACWGPGSTSPAAPRSLGIRELNVRLQAELNPAQADEPVGGEVRLAVPSPRTR